MDDAKTLYNRKRGEILVHNLQNRHFEACYCENRHQALEKALEWIPIGATVGWGGCKSAEEIGLLNAVRNGKYHALDRSACQTPEQKKQMAIKSMTADVFLTGANGISMDGQMVNIDGTGNRVSSIIYGPEFVLVIAGMNKVSDSLESAVKRARTVAAPMNQQRFHGKTPCSVTGSCADCISDDCICNQIVITRNCRPDGRIKFIIVGEDLGF